LRAGRMRPGGGRAARLEGGSGAARRAGGRWLEEVGRLGWRVEAMLQVGRRRRCEEEGGRADNWVFQAELSVN
jgi:hypothetical protein